MREKHRRVYNNKLHDTRDLVERSSPTANEDHTSPLVSSFFERMEKRFGKNWGERALKKEVDVDDSVQGRCVRLVNNSRLANSPSLSARDI